MGYQVDRQLSIEPNPEGDEALIEFHTKLMNEKYWVDFEDYGFTRDSWHHINENMCEYSLAFPDLIFCFTCEGSDGNRWEEYFKNGLMQTCDGDTVYNKMRKSRWRKHDEEDRNDTWIDRLHDEKKELDEKIEKLNAFLAPHVNHVNITKETIMVMRQQLDAMIKYSTILQERIDLAK